MSALPRRQLVALTATLAVVVAGFAAPTAAHAAFIDASGGGVTTTPTNIKLTGTIRDFEHTTNVCSTGQINPDFQSYSGDGPTTGLVEPTLGDDGQPQLLSTGPATLPQITSADSFHQWYHDTPGVTIDVPYDLPLAGASDQTSATGVRYTISNSFFFPADGHGWADATNCPSETLPQTDLGDDGHPHNFSFTYHAHSQFTYQPGETLDIGGDDDVWVFLNDKLFIDLGGLHSFADSGTFSLSDDAQSLGLVANNTYDFDLFFAERHTTASTLSINTTMLLNANFSASNLQLSNQDDGSVPPGANDVAINDIPPAAYPLATQDAVASAPVRSVPVRSVPVRSVPVRSVPVRSVPVRSVPVRSVPLDAVLLSQIPLIGTTWQQQLVGTSLEGAEPTTVTLVQALDALQAANKPGPTLGQMDLSQTPLRNMTLASIFLGSSTLNNLAIMPPSDAPSGNSNFQNWCLWFKEQGDDVCATQSLSSSTSTLLSADLVGAPVRSVPVRSVPVRSVPASAPVRSVNLSDIDQIGQTPIGQVPLTALVLKNADTTDTKFGAIALSATHSNVQADATSAGLALTAHLSSLAGQFGFGNLQLADLGAGLAGLTVGDLIDALTDAYAAQMTLGDLLVSIVPAQTVDWESTPLEPLQLPRYDASPGVATYHVGLDLAGTPSSADGTISVTLPSGFRFAGVESGLNTGPESGESASFDPTTHIVTFTLKHRDVPSSPSIVFDANPTLSEGSAPSGGATASFTAGNLTDSANTGSNATANVQDSYRSSTPSEAQQIAPDHLIIGHISLPGEIDYYRLPVPPSGTHVHVLLSHLPTDDDLVVYGPSDASIASAPVRSVPVRSVPLLDDGIDSATGATATTPQLLNDIPLLPGRQELGQSNHRSTDGEEVDTLSSGDGTYYTIQVTGYNGAASSSPYLLRVVEDAPTPVTCTTPGQRPQSTADALRPLPTATGATHSLFLVNTQQMESAYGADSDGADRTAPLLSALDAFAARADVAGLVVPIDANQGVVDAYNAWNLAPCDPAAANSVVDAVNALVRQYKSSAPNLTSVVLIGSDQQLPMRRITDLTLSSNENGYAESDSVGPNSDNPLSAAQKHGDLLSDDPYGSLTPIGWLDRRLYLPDLAVGRLVESPEEIEAQLNQFVSAGGALTPSTALTTGYDFLADGSQAVDTALAHDGISSRQTLIDAPTSTTPWTRSDLLSKLFPSSGAAPWVDSINAHFDHNRLLPSAGNAGVSSDLVGVQDVTDNTGKIPGRVLFSMGCHAGLNVPDDYVGPGTAMARDWAQTFADEKAIWVANTGYGLGDTASVALSEEVMKLFAQRLNGSMTAGQALQFAKQAYFGELGAYGVYDEKALEEPVFYGLPMWRVGGARWDPPVGTATPAPVPGPVNPPSPPTNPAAANATSSSTTDGPSGLAATDITINPTFTATSGADAGNRGTYWSVGGEVQDTHYRPIQPRTSVGVTPPSGTEAHGALITGLTSDDHSRVDPVFGRPTIDLSAHEPEPSAPDVAFPAQFETLTQFQTPTGVSNRLVMLAGQFFSNNGSVNGTQRLFTTMKSRVLYSSSSSFVPPTFSSATNTLGGGTATFTINAHGNNGASIARVLVLFHTPGNPQWSSLDLSGSGGVYTGSAPVNADNIEWFGEIEDTYGNVGVTDDKGQLFASVTDFHADVSGPAGSNGWFTGPVSIDATGPSANYVVSATPTGGGSASTGAVPYTLMTDGTYDVSVTGDDGIAHHVGVIKIDSVAPTLDSTAPTTPNPLNFNVGSGLVSYSVNCVDPGGSGVADCPPSSTIDTSTLRGGLISFTLHDNAGNSAPFSLPYTVGSNFVGFTQPVNDPYTSTTYSIFKAGSTIPLKFQLKDAGGHLLADSLAQSIANGCSTGAGARLSFLKTNSLALPPPNEFPSTDPADTGVCFRYDATAHQFIFNLSTKSASMPTAGPNQKWALRVVVTFGGGTIAAHEVAVGLS